ncbi:uncharacterized protein LOC129578447 [Sitodiplosis mosellana]|uniref:uncharacterized protein LOC129578447 n=1 Tax=Sitodiplosis mosellana TaxID=263140 RepID=UPI0024443B59|nr:uncharacterized protein LOC129578447 [Sitodiplosis mosellana]
MRNGDLPQGMYTRIPQNIDSESEEEFRLQMNNCQLKGSQIVARNLKSSNMHTTMSRLPESLPDVRFANTQSHYSNHSRMPSDADNVAILNANLRKTQPMGLLRKAVFIISIFLCIFTVIFFVWILPCSESNSCPANRIHTHNWLRSYERVELKGTINVVPGIRGRSKNLVFMYRRNSFFKNDDTPSTGSSKQNGIISLIGSSGQVAWYDELANEPSIIDCNLIDADSSGDTDCLVIDELGQMSCINPVSGQWIWHVAETNIPGKLNFPLVLPDINGDGVKDLLIASTVNISNQNHTNNALKLISGANGKQIGRSYIVKKCSFIHRFHIDAQLIISFNCIINDTDIRIMNPLQEIYTRAMNQSIYLPERSSEIENNQHKFYGQRKDTLRQRNIYSVNEKQLIVENNGVCPESCNVTLTILEESKGKPKILRNFNGTRMYGMVPARLSFNNSQDPLKSSVHGFVIKFWEWSTNETDKFTSVADKNSINRADNSTEFNRFDNILRKKRSWNLVHPNANANEQKQETSNKNVPDPVNIPSALNNKIATEMMLASQMRIIKETIVLIIFNSSDIRIENTSQSNIVQFCRNDGRNEVCQPDLNYQENSVLIADLDQDGSQELVSYYSTFVEDESEASKWKLSTYVQLLRLQSELPKLYAVGEKH